jgi:spermidine synthase
MAIITLVVVFGCGTAMMSFEILGSRVLAPYFGSSVTVWACLIGVFLAALSVGNLLGGRAADWKPVSGLLALIIVAAAVTSVLVPLVSEPICARITERRFGFPLDPLLATAALFFLPTLFLGAVTPFAIRMLLPSVERAGITAGGVYGLSTVGNIFGTFLTAFYLIQTFGVTRILFFWSGFLLVLGAVLAIAPSRRAVAAKRAMLIAMPLCAYLATVCPPSRAVIVYRRDTLYHHILVEDRGGIRLLRFDASIQSSMSLANPLEGALEYTDYFHTAFVFNPNIRSTLFIGLGGGSAPKRFLADYPNMRVDVVEIDPVVVDVAEQFFGVVRDPRLNIVVEDGRTYLNRTSRQYDLIVADAYLSSAYGPYIPFHLATREFFEKSRDRLTVGGVLVYNVIGTVQGPQSTNVRSIYKTMASVFPSLYMFPAETSMNVVIVATKRKVSYTPPQIYDIGNRLFLERRVRLPAFLRRLTRCIASVPPLADVPILTDDFAPMERLQSRGIGTQPEVDAAKEGTEEQESTPQDATEKDAD